MTNRTNRGILDALGEPFPSAAIKQRQGAGGKSFRYVEAETVIRRLNSATNGDWSFHIRSVDWRDDVMLCQGELTIPGLGTRTGFGVQQVKAGAGEDLLKGAASDALKKSATLFGVGLELYPGSDYESDVSHLPTSDPQAPPRPIHAASAPQPLPETAQRPSAASELAATDRQRNLIATLARELKLNGQALDARCVERFGRPYAEISRKDASAIIEGLKEAQQERAAVAQ